MRNCVFAINRFQILPVPAWQINRNRRSRSAGTLPPKPPDEVEAQDEGRRHRKQREGIQRAGHEADGDTAMTRRDDEISDLKRRWLRVATGRKGAGLMNSEAIFSAAAVYRRRCSRTPCAAMISSSWCSALPNRKTRRLLPSALVGIESLVAVLDAIFGRHPNILYYAVNGVWLP
jgi:hypothetical protein